MSQGIPIAEILDGSVISTTEDIPVFSCPANRVREVNSIVFTYTGTVAGLAAQVLIDDGVNKVQVDMPAAGLTSGQPVDLTPDHPLTYGEATQIVVRLTGATLTNTYTVHVAGSERLP